MKSQTIISPEDQKVTFVELFFDLVFVFSVTQVVSLLHHGLDWAVVGQATLVFWLVWWATVGATYVLWSLAAGAIGVVVFYLGHILSDLGWYSMVSLVVARGRRLMSQRIYRGLLLVCGVALIGLGVYFLVSGAIFLTEV